jgi:hypothetical protein
MIMFCAILSATRAVNTHAIGTGHKKEYGGSKDYCAAVQQHTCYPPGADLSSPASYCKAGTYGETAECNCGSAEWMHALADTWEQTAAPKTVRGEAIDNKNWKDRLNYPSQITSLKNTRNDQFWTADANSK